jgi:hypothetical protein
MKKLLLSLILVTGLVAGGCTSAQTQQAEQDLVKVLKVAESALLAVGNDPATLQKAEAALSALAAIAPQTGPVHQAIVDAQAALNAVIANKATMTEAELALDAVISLLEQDSTIPRGVVPRAFGSRGAVAPVHTKVCCGNK